MLPWAWLALMLVVSLTYTKLISMQLNYLCKTMRDKA